MPEDAYSIKEMISEMRGDIGGKLDALNLKVSTTNGRVKKLEINRAFIQGGLAVISVMLVPIFIFVIQQYIGARIQQAVLTNNQQYQTPWQK